MDILTGLTVLAVSFSANVQTKANNTAVLTANDQGIASQMCIVAVRDGLKEVRKLAVENNLNYGHVLSNLSCNGKLVSAFAKQYSQNPKQVVVKAGDKSLESQVCVDALSLGEKAARQKHHAKSELVTCNGESISDFVRKYADRDLVLNQARNIAQTK